MASKKERKEVKDLLNEALKIIDAAEGNTEKVEVKNGESLASLIRIIQMDYDIGIDGGGGDREDLFYEFNENIREEDEED